MSTAYLIVVISTMVANAGAAAADFARARFVLGNAVELRLPESWVPTLGALKLAGAIGLLLGLLGVRYLDLAAATGLVLFFTGAIIVHIRARVFYKIAFPGGFLALAVGSLAFTVVQ